MRDTWKIKKNLANSISNRKIDNIIEILYNNNAYGAKILGAGGGGFIYLISEKKNHNKIIESLKGKGLEKVNYKFTNNKSTVIKID